MSQQETGKPGQEAFLSSMTFSLGEFGRGCDCDECEMIPPDIRQAIQRHKRQKLENLPLMRTQDRTLVKREESISVWKQTMPLNAEPLIEFGNNHRIIFVSQLPEGSTAASVGKGVLGSSDETKGRSNLEWTQGKAYFVHSNGGKALGWLHTNTETSEQSSGHVIIYNIKVPLSDENIRSIGAEEDSIPDKKWAKDIFQIFAQAIIGPKPVSHEIEKGEQKAESEPLIDPPLSGVEMSAEDSAAIAKIIALLETQP